MNTPQAQRYNYLYEQHLINLRLQGKRPSTIDAYTRAVNMKCIARVFHERPSREANTIRIMVIVNDKEKGEQRKIT